MVSIHFYLYDTLASPKVGPKVFGSVCVCVSVYTTKHHFVLRKIILTYHNTNTSKTAKMCLLIFKLYLIKQLCCSKLALFKTFWFSNLVNVNVILM